jgi:acetyltransferase-like isoleucine patch superfamily enzyme
VTDDIVIHPTADVSPRASIGRATRIWNNVQVREDAHIGAECILGKGVYIDFGVTVGDRCKIQNNASVFHGATLEEGVFIGPHACITNDRLPRAITPQGALKGVDDWEVGPIVLRYGCSVGAGALVLPNVTVGRFALVGAGAVVTRSVPDHALVVGNPARISGFVCACGGRLELDHLTVQEVLAPTISGEPPISRHGHCSRCGMVTVLVPSGDQLEPEPA